MDQRQQNLINVYHNCADIDSLCITLSHDLQSSAVLITWHIMENLWYIPTICINGQMHSNDKNGWYLTAEPTPGDLTKINKQLADMRCIKFATITGTQYKGQLFTQNDTNINPLLMDSPSMYYFIVESYINKLIYADVLRRNKLKQELTLGNISHSIRTPLNGILHMSNMLINENTSNNEHLSYLNQSAVALANSIFDIIDMTKLELGNLKINKEIFNIRELINNVMAIANTFTKSATLELEYYIEPSVPEYIYSDAKRIKQILVNLLENSIHHTETGYVMLHVSAALINLADEDDIVGNKYGIYATDYQHSLSFMIKDTGTGMSDAVRETLFKPADVVGNRQQGISLRISYLLAKYLGGNVELVYSNINQGSCFQFNIIVCEEEPPEINSITLKSLKDKTVLLIEDSNDKIAICKIMDKYNMHYIISSSYEEVLILHINKRFDLIVVKIELKQENGIDITNHLHSKFSHTGTKFIALSAGTQNIPKLLFDEIIVLPAEETEYKGKLLNIFNNKPRRDTNNCNILIVEDEQINRIILEKLLRNMGYINIDLAINGVDALKIITKNMTYYDVILLDIRMPLMDGFEFAKNVYTIFTDLDRPIPKMLGITAQMILDDDPKEYIDDFIYKPVDANELNKKIRELMSI